MRSLTPSSPRRGSRTKAWSVRYLYLLLLSCAIIGAVSWSSNAVSAACNFLLQWGDLGDGPRGITFSGGNLFVANSDTEIQKRSPAGALLLHFGTGGSGPGQFVNPSGIAVSPVSGDIYVTDSFESRSNIVQRFSSSGVFINGWGTNGTGAVQFIGAGGVAVDSAGNVYVADSGNHRIQKFTSTGTPITTWGSSGAGNGQFNGPQGIAVDALDKIYVADTGNNRIQKFSSTGTFELAFGTVGTADGQFMSPQGVSIDSTGTIFVADTGNSRIQTFSNTGTWMSTCGTNGTGPGEFNSAQDIAVDDSGNFYVADTGNDRVQKFGEGAAAPPIANAGIDQTVECAGATTAVNLDGSASTAGSGSITSYAWTDGATSLGSGQMLSVSLATGSHTITLTVTDSGGGTDTDDVVVNVVDTLAPAITCPSNIVVNLPLNSTATSMTVNYPAVTAIDACSSSVTVNSTPASGSTFPIGTTTVHATADDGAGHTSSCSFTVTVAYNFAGFFPPVDNLPALNVVQAGRAIPVKFSLSGYKGLGIFAAGSPESGPIACNSSDPAVDLTETVNAGGSSLSYNPTTDQYNYVWKTEGSWAGTCRQLVVTLNDGSTHRANFKFK